MHALSAHPPETKLMRSFFHFEGNTMTMLTKTLLFFMLLFLAVNARKISSNYIERSNDAGDGTLVTNSILYYYFFIDIPCSKCRRMLRTNLIKILILYDYWLFCFSRLELTVTGVELNIYRSEKDSNVN